MLIAPVISFIADYLGFGDLPSIDRREDQEHAGMDPGPDREGARLADREGQGAAGGGGDRGKKDEKKDEKGGTPHEQAVREVADTLSQPSTNEGIEYDALRTAKEQEAAMIVAARNESLAAEHVKMSVTFADRSSDEADHDLDFSVSIAPNTATSTGKVPVPVPEPVAGEHVVKRAAPHENVKGESHHVPAKGLGFRRCGLP